MVLIIWYLVLQIPVQLVPITINVASSNHAHGEVNSINHWLIKFDTELRQVGVFLWSPPRYILNIVESGVKHHVILTITLYAIYCKSKKVVYHIGFRFIQC